MFGGLDERGKPTDELYWIRFDFEHNMKCVSPGTGEYKSNIVPDIRIIARKIEPIGRAPIPRCQHSATVFKNQLIIHGGRSDTIYPIIHNVALNDLHIYDIAKNTWCAIALYGDIPNSRWGHKLVALENKIVLFGGMNLTTYNESEIFQFEIGKQQNSHTNSSLFNLDDQKVIEFLS